MSVVSPLTPPSASARRHSPRRPSPQETTPSRGHDSDRRRDNRRDDTPDSFHAAPSLSPPGASSSAPSGAKTTVDPNWKQAALAAMHECIANDSGAAVVGKSEKQGDFAVSLEGAERPKDDSPSPPPRRRESLRRESPRRESPRDGPRESRREPHRESRRDPPARDRGREREREPARANPFASPSSSTSSLSSAGPRRPRPRPSRPQPQARPQPQPGRGGPFEKPSPPSPPHSEARSFAREQHRKDEERMQMEEKMEILSRLHGSIQDKGYKPHRLLTLEDSIEEIRYEFFRAQRELSKKRNVRVMSKALVSFGTGLEVFTKWWNPMGLRLQGFSKSLLLSIHDYTEIFEELHDKYADAVSMPVEAKLVLTLVSSIYFHHINVNVPPPRGPMGGPMGGSQGRMSGPRVSVEDSDDDEEEEVPLRGPAPSGGLGGANVLGMMGPSMLQALLSQAGNR